jgi:hypothetical protein
MKNQTVLFAKKKQTTIMEGSNINTVLIQKSERFKREKVVSATFNNYSLVPVIINHQGVDIELPTATDVNGTLVPIPFRFDFGNTFFDLDVLVKFPSRSGKIIIHYGIKNC